MTQITAQQQDTPIAILKPLVAPDRAATSSANIWAVGSTLGQTLALHHG